jgi:hypothetical protein
LLPARELVVEADRLYREPFAEFPAQIVAGDKTTEPRVEGHHVIVLEIHFDERFPVVIALVHFDVIEQIIREIEIAAGPGPDRGEVARNVALAIKEQAVPILQRRFAQTQARRVGKVRCAEQGAVEPICPTV